MGDLVPVRAELARGDLRALYLGWLLCVEDGEVGDDAIEPPVPAGLARLSVALQELVEFLRIDPDLVTACAMESPKRRSVAELRRAGEQIRETRERVEAEKAAAASARRERAAARARAKHLDQLAGEEPGLWEQVKGLAAAKNPKS